MDTQRWPKISKSGTTTEPGIAFRLIKQFMEKSREIGMQTFDQHLVELVKLGKISIETAKLAATNAAEMELMLTIDK